MRIALAADHAGYLLKNELKTRLVALGHTRRPEIVPELEEMVRQARPRASIDLVSEIGPTVGTHAGPGAYAVAFVHDPLDEE